MAIIKSDDILQKWYYENVFIRMILEDSDDSEEYYIDISPERLTSINIMEDFETMFFPLLSIVLTVEDSVYYDIIKHIDEC